MSSKGKKTLIVFAIIMIFVLISNIFAATIKNYTPKYGKLTANVNFRSKPDSTKASIIKILSKGTAVKMVAEVSNFYIVQTGANEVGYVSKDYIASTTTAPSGAKTYTSKTQYYATINSNSTNIRQGPTTSFKVVTMLNKGAKVQVLGIIDNFLLVVTDTNSVGMIRSDLVTKTSTTTTGTTTTPTATTTGTSDEQLILNLMNQERAKVGVPALKMDAKLLDLARLKAKDMVAKNYFSHTSPTYGSPFAMMQNNGVTYKTAGENIAGNPSLEAAVKSWMASEGHRKNILSNTYNYCGVGIAKSDIYGYVISVMFIGR